MNKKDEIKIDVLSSIDDDLIEKHSQKRYELTMKPRKKRKKLVAWLSAAASLMLIFGILMAVILPVLTKQVPVYQGMTVSGEFPMSQSANAESILPEYMPISLSLTEPTYINPYNLSTGNGNGNANGHDKNGKTDIPEETVVEQVKDSLNIVGGEKSIYYAEKEQDIYITVHVDNPDSFEILSFTLNGKKYSSYMFEEGSDMENLVLKVNVGDVEGIVEYTIDAIKYIDGTEIKDVKMEGDKTVKVGVATDKQPTAVISGEKISFNDISLSVAITDTLNLLELSEGRVDVVLYEGENIIANKSLSIADATSIKFDGLKPATEYTYVIAASYDALDGSGFNTYILASKTFTTLEAVMFENVNVGQESVSFGLIWDENYSDREIVSIALYQGETKIKDIETTANSIDELLSNNEYTVIVEYKNNGKTENIYLTFTTVAKAKPKVTVTRSSITQTSVEFGVSFTDIDGVGEITKIELLHKNGNRTAENTAVRSFSGLLSNNTYTVKVTYTYDLNDGKGEQTSAETLELKTAAKTIPTLSIINPSKTQTSVGFGIDYRDPDAVGVINKIELVHATQGTVSADNLNVREFKNLLSNNTYTVKVSYTYNLNDGQGDHIEIKKLDIKTDAKTEPTVTINNPTKTQTSVGFGVDITDIDNICTVTSVELVHATRGTLAAENVSVRKFENLLSNNIYTVKVTYTYDLNDGDGVHTKSVTLDIKTDAKTEPTVTINNPTKTQTSVGFGVDITDIDNICTVKSVELVHATRGTLAAENVSVREFENLLSNNIYTVKVTYTYDLNDGDGVHTKSVTLDIRTEPKLKPVIEIADLDYNIKHIEFNVTETDVDNTGGVTKVELYQGDTLARTSNSLTGALFDELLSDTKYTVKITYEYDLNDGVGKHTETVTETIKTRYDFGVGDWEPSKGLEITNGVITGIGSCNDTVLFIDKPIGSDAFSSRDSLLAIEKLYMYGEEGSYIDGSAFDSCEFLTDIRIGGKLDYIWGWAFAQCIHLENVKIDYVKYMDACVFDYCDSLKNVEIGYVETIESGVFTDCKLLESIVIPEGTVSITGAFFGCSSLKTVVLPESLKTIGAETFNGCSSLKNINIPEGVTTIGDEAFKNCTALKTVTIPDGVKFMGADVFAYTNNLTVYVSAGCDTKFWKSNWMGNATVIYLNDSPETDGAVKVATFNIANGREVNYDYSLLAQDIIDSGAVIIGLQEVDMNTTRNGKQDTMKLISEAVGFEYYVFGASLENYREGQFGNAILSKYPIISSEVIKLPRLTDTEEQRTLLHAVIQIGDATVDYFVTHIQQSSATVQFDEINAHLSECETFILVGDFNYSPDEAMFGRFENSYMINTKSDSITETTVDGHDFDNIILPDGIEHEGIRVINTGHSDHYMLVVDVILNNSSNE